MTATAAATRQPAERQRRGRPAPLRRGRRASRETTPPLLASARAGWSAHAPSTPKARGSRPARPHAERPPARHPVCGCRAGGRQTRSAAGGRSGGSPHPRRSSRPAAAGPGRRADGAAGGAGGGRPAAAARTAAAAARAAAAAGRTAAPAGRRRRAAAARLLAAPGAGWFAHCAAFGQAARAAPGGCAARAAARGRRTPGSPSPSSMPSSAQIGEVRRRSVSIQANSVSTKPSAARPTVIQERGKPSFRSVKAGQQRPDRRQQEQEERRSSRCPSRASR